MAWIDKRACAPADQALWPSDEPVIRDFRLTSLMIPRLLVPFLLAVTLPTTGTAQNPLARMAEVRRAINAGDAATALALLDSLRAIAPDHPNVVFLSAHANGLAGRDAEARAALARLLRWDARYARAALRDTNVAALRR